MIAKLRYMADLDERSLYVNFEARVNLMREVAAAIESEAEELRRVRDGIRQDAKAILIKSEQSGDSLGVDHVATRSLDYAACAMMTWAEDLSKLIGVEK